MAFHSRSRLPIQQPCILGTSCGSRWSSFKSLAFRHGDKVNATRQLLPNLSTCRVGMLTYRAAILTTQSNVGPTNQPDKPPSEGVTLSWRSDHETALKHTQGRALALPLKRATRRRTIKRLSHTALLAEMPHYHNRIHDGQEWSELGHSLPTSQSGQE